MQRGGAVLSQRRAGNGGGAGRQRADRPPSRRRRPTAATERRRRRPSKTASVPLPTVSVEGTRPRAPLPPPSRAAPRPRRRPRRRHSRSRPRELWPPRLGATPYQVTNTGITRLPVPILNTPQTVNVVTQQVIQEQASAPSRTRCATSPASPSRRRRRQPGRHARSSAASSAQSDLFRDGVRDPGWYTRDAFAIDRVEVYKGPRRSRSDAAPPAAPSTSSPSCRPASNTSNRRRR